MIFIEINICYFLLNILIMNMHRGSFVKIYKLIRTECIRATHVMSYTISKTCHYTTSKTCAYTTI